MRGKISDGIRLMHIVESIDKIENAVKGKTFDDFFDDEVLRAAIIHWLGVIGEAARYISDETKEKYTEVEWRKMTGMRNVMIHKYFDVDYQAVWKAVMSLKTLKPKIEAINLDLNDNFLTN